MGQDQGQGIGRTPRRFPFISTTLQSCLRQIGANHPQEWFRGLIEAECQDSGHGQRVDDPTFQLGNHVEAGGRGTFSPWGGWTGDAVRPCDTKKRQKGPHRPHILAKFVQGGGLL